MPSPFPGMDPYLEHPTHFPDFHSCFVNYWREALNAVLPSHYTARIGERVYLVEGPPISRKLIQPDVAVERQPGSRASATATAAAPTTLAPVTLPLLLPDEVIQTHIEILHRSDRSLVAVLELLSPTNKENPGYSGYLAKRNGILLQNVHLVELDLLRAGQRPPLKVELPPGDYYYLVSPADRRMDCDVYAWTLRDSMPSLPVPLRQPDPDVVVDYAALFNLVYERGRYAREIDYAQAPPGRHTDENLAWIASRLSPTSASSPPG